MSDSSETAILRDEPYKDVELLRRLYFDEQRSAMGIGEMLDCSPNTVRKYLKEDGAELRTRSEALKIAKGHHPNEIPFGTHENGPEVWWPSGKDADVKHVYVHRLVAVAEYGFDEVADSHIHHKNEIRWDNRPQNLEPMDPGEHSSHHNRKLTEEKRREIAERYYHGQESSYEVAEDYPISANTVRNITREHYGALKGGEKAT